MPRKKLLILSFGGDHTGTGSDVHTGGIYGDITMDDTLYTDTVSVVLYEGPSLPLKQRAPAGAPADTVVAADGSYRFDGLAAGEYTVAVYRDSVLIGSRADIRLGSGQVVQVNITVVIIIQQYFTIVIDSSRNVTIVHVHVHNGSAAPLDSGYVVSFAEQDTQRIRIELTEDGRSGTVDALLISNGDGTYRVEILDADPPVDLVLKGSTAAARMTVTVGEPGTRTLEATFDTTGVPQ